MTKTPCYKHQIYHTEKECPKCGKARLTKMIEDALNNQKKAS